MNKLLTAVIGGGAAGLAAAVMLARRGERVLVLERGPRVGRKLAATGNGQGNVTNCDMSPAHYRSDDPALLSRVLAFSDRDAVKFLQSMGGIFLPDARGRVYPASRQASAITDLFRRELARLGVDVRLNADVKKLTHVRDFVLSVGNETLHADRVLLAAGGKAAPNFGTDGTAYALAEGFGHTVTSLSPALVALKCDPALIRGLRGVRIDAALSVRRGEKTVFSGRGDLLFTDCGVSGDLIFRASSLTVCGDLLEIDLLPDVDEGRLLSLLEGKPSEDALLCVLPNALARRIARGGDMRKIKNFPIKVTGDLGFARAQVTRGGIPLGETDGLESKLRRGLYFAGEILNVDGDCGGYNLHWAFASANYVAEHLL